VSFTARKDVEDIEDDMTCRQLKSDAMDFARGAVLDRRREAALERHVRSCPRCAALVERQRAISSALQGLARERGLPAMNPRQLNSLLAAFDRPRARSRRATIAVGLSLAASVLIVVSLSVGVKREAPAPGSSEAVAATLAPPTGADGAFVVLPGATALPRLESGRLIRVEIPESELSSVGLWPPTQTGGAIQADVLVGQDGLARAVRFVQ
jgi:anti-sigma factor RsiW